ncbi:hypothetical protein TsocGM_12455 [Tautonia sociabilis]|uniref:Large conductance mechanosensitive channel protein MscL n=1 Tax=Tautonia sociabilis TaxID=2080755 RepID=A0A432MJ73_9BACT|nr:hypothetical protein TsocGM_12455 [Tautonia sociabilis]
MLAIVAVTQSTTKVPPLPSKLSTGPTPISALFATEPVLGGAFQQVVNGLVEFVLMPMLSYVTPEVETLADWTIGRIRIGAFLAAIVNFALIAIALFLVIRKVIGSIRKAIDPPDPSEPTTKECPFCLSKIPDQASRCAYCTSDLPPVLKPARGGVPGA